MRAPMLLALFALHVSGCSSDTDAIRGAERSTLAIRGVTVLDVESGSPMVNRTVLVRGRRVIAVDSGNGRAPLGATVIDATGKFLIPGLWDMHVHTTDRVSFAQHVAHGVLGIRDMGGGVAHDAACEGGIPGASLHEELRLLVEAGLTPLQSLQAATLNPARYLGATDSLGTVAPGKLVDFVLLDGNPLVDIRHTSRIHGVVRDGRWLNRAVLDDLPRQAVPSAARQIQR